MTLQYIDLSERYGHRDDHGFERGAEFNVKLRRRTEIPDFVREQLSEPQIDELWWEEARRSRDELQSELRRRYKWVGRIEFVGRGPGWLVIEDTGDDKQLGVSGRTRGLRPRNWDAVGKIVEQRLREFVSRMEDADTWRAIRGIDPTIAVPAPTKTPPAQLKREIEAVVGRRSSRRSAPR
jgi:hypothetical protein